MTHAIDPAGLRLALLQGALRVEHKRDELNRVNAYPVPDMDTGNNLAYLMAQLRRQLPQADAFEDLLLRLSEASLLGARGNSGAIFSQYFSGFLVAVKRLGTLASLQANDLGRLFEAGYASACQAIQQPREGTVLTAMRSFSEAFSKAIEKLGSLPAAVETTLAQLKTTVLDTMNTLPQQRALKAPDAGALGFYYFAEGFLRSLLGEESEPDAQAEPLPMFTLTAVPEDIPPGALTYRYCTEAVLRVPEGLPAGAEDALKAMGDSMVISRSGNLMRVHVHTNEPARAVQVLASAGELMETKADDMQAQQALARRHPGQIALVVDSIADVPPALLGEHAYVLPLTLLADGVSYQDRRTISNAQVIALSGKLSSSQLNLEQVRQFLDPVLNSYDQALIVCVSSRMSGLFSRYQEYLQGIGGGRVRLVDSRANSAAQGLLALKAARMLQDGASLDTAADVLEELLTRTRILVSLQNLDAMVASGRLKRGVGKVLQKVGYLPLVTIDREGSGGITGLSFSPKRAGRLLLHRVLKAKPEVYAVVHFDNPERAQALAGAITQTTGIKPQYISDISAVVANFAGAGACAVAWVEGEKAGAW